MVVHSLVRIVRLASVAICLLAVASLVGFAVEQSKGASAHQQVELNSASPVTASDHVSRPNGGESGLRKAIDDAFAKFSSPFSSLTNSIASQWALHLANTLLALLVYGFGLGLLARVVRFGD